MKQIITLLTIIILAVPVLAQQVMWERQLTVPSSINTAFIKIVNQNDTAFVISGMGSLSNAYPSFFSKYISNGGVRWSKTGRNIYTGEQGLVISGPNEVT